MADIFKIGGLGGKGSLRVLDTAGAVTVLLNDVAVLAGQQAAIVSLTDSTGGTANNTVAQVADIALSTSNTYTDAAVNGAVNTAIATVNDDLADLAAKIEEILDALRAHGLIAT